MNLAIYRELRKRYETGFLAPPTEFPNEVLKKPDTLWNRFHVESDTERQIDIGATPHTFRILGVLIIQVFAPLDEGTVPALTVAEQVAATFRNWSGETVSCYAATIKPVGNDGEGRYQVNVVVPFKQDTLH